MNRFTLKLLKDLFNDSRSRIDMNTNNLPTLNTFNKYNEESKTWICHVVLGVWNENWLETCSTWRRKISIFSVINATFYFSNYLFLPHQIGIFKKNSIGLLWRLNHFKSNYHHYVDLNNFINLYIGSWVKSKVAVFFRTFTIAFLLFLAPAYLT